MPGNSPAVLPENPLFGGGGRTAVDEQRKRAYRYLLYWAMLDIRAVQWLGRRSWRAWSPLYWRRELRRVQYAGAVADWLHNLALYSSVNFQGFNEDWFWRDFETVRSRYSEFGLAHYQDLFEQHADQPPEFPNAEPAAEPDRRGV